MSSLILSLEHSLPYTFYQRLKFLMLNSKISKRHSIYRNVLHGSTCGCAGILELRRFSKALRSTKCRRRKHCRNKIIMTAVIVLEGV